jgi:hypothetical protein
MEGEWSRMLIHDEFDGENVFLEQKVRRFFLVPK